jgi:HrpA-like RNA helicase
MYETAALIIQKFDETDSHGAIEEDEKETESPRGKPAVLVFLPGIVEIETMEKTLKQLQ